MRGEKKGFSSTRDELTSESAVGKNYLPGGDPFEKANCLDSASRSLGRCGGGGFVLGTTHSAEKRRKGTGFGLGRGFRKKQKGP